jgi:hypothetical protein
MKTGLACVMIVLCVLGGADNGSDLFVCGMPEGHCLQGTVEFLRISLGTLKDAKTDINELYAWQFDGPFLRDFAGRTPTGKRDAGALEFVTGQ